MSFGTFLRSVGNFLRPIGRTLAIGMIAVTGIGLIYLLAKTHVIKEGERGISFDKGKLTVLKPGVHLLLSPLHEFDHTLPVDKDVVVTLEEFEIKSRDRIPTLIQAAFSYRIEATAPENAILKVDDYKKSVKEAVKSTISSTLQQYDFDDLTSAPILSPTAKSAVPDSTEAESDDQEKKSDTHPVRSLSLHLPTTRPQMRRVLSSTSVSVLSQIQSALNELGKRWGIIFSDRRLISVEAKDTEISNQMATTTMSLMAARARAEAIEIEAKAQARARAILAEGDAKAIEAMAKAKTSAIKHMASQLTTEHEMAVYQTQTELDQTRALGATTGSISLGRSVFPLFSHAADERMAGELKEASALHRAHQPSPGLRPRTSPTYVS